MEQFYTRMSSKGQLVIPAAIREELGIEPGTRVSVCVEGMRLVLEPETLALKLRKIKGMRGCAAGFPPGTNLLLEDRRLERERELAQDGY